MIPNSVIFTGFWCITLFYSLTFFIFGNVINVVLNRLQCINFLVPSNVPKLLYIILIPIELISHISKVFSLGIRLFSNILSGHILMNIFESFFLELMLSNPPYIINLFLIKGYILFFIITILELVIAFLQAYVFITLVIFYYKESFSILYNKKTNYNKLLVTNNNVI